MGFTYFYTAVIFDVRDLSDNLKKYGGQIRATRPDVPNTLYMIEYSLVSLLPAACSWPPSH
jgi:preprotein translocase subunit SecY